MARLLSMTLCLTVAAVCGLSCGRAAAQNAATAYDVFNTFCIKYFGAEKEPLVYETFDKELKFLPDGSWRHVSETSASIAFETNLPAKTTVEYGETAQYGKKTPEPERHFYLHLHALKDLKPNTTYHYRLVATDERGNKVTAKDATFETAKVAGAVHVPGDLDGPPYVLDRNDTTYVLTQDVNSDGTGIFVAASGVTVDLNGHTVTYDRKKDTTRQGACGVRGHKRKGLKLSKVKVLNGTIRRGGGQSTTRRLYEDLYGAMYFYGAREMEIAGVTVDYSGEQVAALVWLNNGERNDIHHNVFLDRETTLINRHRGIDMLSVAFTNSNIHHNLVKRTRHRGLRGGGVGSAFHSNEIYVDSWATNSYGLWVADDTVGHHNRIFGSGFHPIGLMLGYINSKNKTYHSNYIQVQAVPRADIVDRWRGGQGGGGGGSVGMGGITPAVGLRLQKGPQENIEFTGNVVVCKAFGEMALTRGMFLVPMSGVRNVTIKNNTIKLIVQDDKADGWAIAGLGERGEQITLEGNTIISNICNVRFGDPYSVGGTYRFVGNTFVRVGRNPRYKTIRVGYRSRPTSGHVFLDCRFEDGAGLDKVSFEGQGERDFTVQWTLHVKATPGTKVAAKDSTGEEVFSGVVPADGRLRVPLSEYRQTPDGRTALTPHIVTVGDAAKTLTMTKPTAFEVTGAAWKAVEPPKQAPQ